MMIDRRTFVAGAALAVVAPFPDLPTQPSSPPAARPSHVVFAIDGWSVQEGGETADLVWIRIDRGWRAAWR